MSLMRFEAHEGLKPRIVLGSPLRVRIRRGIGMQVGLKCPKCGHEYLHNIRKKLLHRPGRCPQCNHTFDITRHQVGPAQARKIKQARIKMHSQRRKTHIEALNYVRLLEVTIKGEQRPRSDSEAEFKQKALSKGWLPHRPSWPDFLVETKDGCFAVEVKSHTDTISRPQQLTFDILEDLGIKVYIWKNTKGKRNSLIRWTNYLD